MTRQLVSNFRVGEIQKGFVKFFNTEKGFGFIGSHSGGPDIFVHMSALEGSEVTKLNKQDFVEFELGKSAESERIFATRVRLLRKAEQSSGGHSGGRPLRGGSKLEKAGQGSGVVKWFDLGKGYGFITPQGGDKDVFVHARVLKRAGLTDLTSGQAVSFELEIDPSRNRLSVSKIVRVSSPGASNRPAGT